MPTESPQRWTFDRWFMVLGISGTIIVNTFDVGGRYQRMRMEQEQTTAKIAVVESKLDVVADRLNDVTVEQVRMRTQMDMSDQKPDPRTPRFGPSYGSVR